jgi:uncharacterized protein YjbI with pentapeptide repeats
MPIRKRSLESGTLSTSKHIGQSPCNNSMIGKIPYQSKLIGQLLIIAKLSDNDFTIAKLSNSDLIKANLFPIIVLLHGRCPAILQ